jgi:hypothetical protein
MCYVKQLLVIKNNKVLHKSVINTYLGIWKALKGWAKLTINTIMAKSGLSQEIKTFWPGLLSPCYCYRLQNHFLQWISFAIVRPLTSCRYKQFVRHGKDNVLIDG